MNIIMRNIDFVYKKIYLGGFFKGLTHKIIMSNKGVANIHQVTKPIEIP